MGALKRLLAMCLGVTDILTRAVRRRRATSAREAAALLRELAHERSATVPDLSARLKVSQPATLSMLSKLEEAGLIRLSVDRGDEHVRIAAITDAGREEVARAP